jgi:hypothetical protein
MFLSVIVSWDLRQQGRRAAEATVEESPGLQF